ncbi:hypothetical protein ACFL1Z_04495 [Thermodesulfobacteriota bacterium]
MLIKIIKSFFLTMLIISSSVSTILAASSTFNYVINDFNFYQTPDIPKPEKGVPIEDPTFNTSITRITDSSTEVSGSTYDYAQPGYPKHNIENADGTMLVIQSYSSTGWHLYNANPPYNKIKDIPTTILNYSDPEVRWDNDSPNILYAHKGPILYQWDVKTGDITMLHDFSKDFPGEEIDYISMGEEGDASDDRRYWAFYTTSSESSTQSHLIVYDKLQDKIVSKIDRGAGTFKTGETSFNDGVWLRDRGSGNVLNYNSVGMSPSGAYVVTGFPPTWVYPRDFSSSRIIDTHGHVDCAIDDEGREVVFWVGTYFGPNNNENYGYWAMMADLETGGVNYLGPFGNIQIFHASGNAHDKPGWALVSSYNPMDCGIPTQWADASIIVYELTRKISKPTWDYHAITWRVAHVHMCRERYSDDPFAKFNKKGTKIFFGSGWGTSVNNGPYDVYQIELPSNWNEDLTGDIEPPSPSSISPSPPRNLKLKN